MTTGEPLLSLDCSVAGFICADVVQVTNNDLLVLEPGVLRSEKVVSLDG